MKKKLTGGILAIVLLLSASVPVHAADCRTERTAGSWGQLVCRYAGGCGTAAEQRFDWNALLRRWLAQTAVRPEQPAQPTEPEQPTQPEAPEPARPVQPETPSADVDASIHASEREVVRLVNAERAKYGLAALAEDESLSALARRKSQDMRDNGYFDHNSPTYGSPFQMMKSFGFSYRAAGENIAMGYRTPAAVVDAWMNSPGHRANILNASYTRIGVGYVAAGNYWTQEFIG